MKIAIEFPKTLSDSDLEEVVTRKDRRILVEIIDLLSVTVYV